MCCPPVASPTIVMAWRTGRGHLLEVEDLLHPSWQLHFLKINNSSLGQKCFLPDGLHFGYGWISPGLTVLMTLGMVVLACEVHSNCTLKNFFNEPVVPPYCQPRVCVDWFSCFCDCQKKAQGFCDWFSLLTINIAGNAFMLLIGCSSCDLIILPCCYYFLLWFNHISRCSIIWKPGLSVENEYVLNIRWTLNFKKNKMKTQDLYWRLRAKSYVKILCF